MEAFYVRLLRRAVWIGEPYLDTARSQFRRIVLRIRTEALYHVRVAEFCTVVGEDCGEKLAEKLCASLLPERIEDSGAGIRSLPFSQETERKRAFREDHREENLSADGSDDGIQFAGDDIFVFLEPLAHFGDCPANATLCVSFRLRLRFWLAASSRKWQVVSFCAEKPGFNPSVDSAASVVFESAFVRIHNGGYGLSFADGRREYVIHIPDVVVGRMDAGSRQPKFRLITGLCGRGDIELLFQRTDPFLLAAIADKRRFG